MEFRKFGGLLDDYHKHAYMTDVAIVNLEYTESSPGLQPDDRLSHVQLTETQV